MNSSSSPSERVLLAHGSPAQRSNVVATFFREQKTLLRMLGVVLTVAVICELN